MVTSSTPTAGSPPWRWPGMVSLRWWCSIEASGAHCNLALRAYQDKLVAELGDRGVRLMRSPAAAGRCGL